MSMEWYRAYHNMPNDPKLKVVARRCGQPMAFVVAVWVCILDSASQHDPRGVIEIDPEEVAVILDIEMETVEAVLKALTSKNLIDDEGNVVKWHKRQHTTSTERSKKSRDRKKQDAADGNDKQQAATACNTSQRKNGKNAPDTDKDTDRDSDTEQITDSYSKKENRTREEKEECEKEKQQISEKSQTQILRQMADIWDAEVQSKLTNDQKVILTKRRKELLTARWIDDFAEDMKAWNYFCEIIGNSDFCLGRIEGKDWTIDLTWAIRSSDRVAKILEGGFSGGNHPPRPPSCEIPEFKEAWDEVIKRMKHHHGPAAIRSWLSNTAVTSVTDTPEGAVLILEVQSKFIRDWIEKNYLTDLNHCWDEVICSHPVAGMKLKIKEVK